MRFLFAKGNTNTPKQFTKMVRLCQIIVRTGITGDRQVWKDTVRVKQTRFSTELKKQAIRLIYKKKKEAESQKYCRYCPGYGPQKCLQETGTWIDTCSLGMEPIRMFFFGWHRNFAISLAVEALVAQPVARRVMVALHTRIDSRTAD